MDAEVIVVGAGPAGLMLAGELRLAGVQVVVLEKLPRPSGESRGLGFTARTMEVFDQRGLLPRFGQIETSALGHFGGVPVDFGVLDGAHLAAKSIPQAETERVLGEWAAELGADVRRGVEVAGAEQDADGVTVTTGTGRLRARFLVGCDGGRSTIRKAGGFDFPGTAATLEMYLADIRGLDLRPRLIGEHFPGGMVMAGPLGDGIDRIIVCERGTPPRRRAEPPSFAEVAAGWQRLTGEDIGHGEPVWVSAFGDATRQVTEYRRGRILLAGDAAHIHLPAGGQGLNVSVQDSVNLGWKLAAEVNGWAPPGLLDGYHTERHPVGRRLLLNTRAQGLLMLGGDSVQPLREVLAELLAYEEVGRHLAGMVSGLSVHYDVGPGEHPLLGRRMPHAELITGDDKTSTTRLLHPATGVLVDVKGGLDASGWAGRVHAVTARPHDPDGPLAGTDAILLRPDGHVAWVGPDGGDLGTALRRWFGEPR